MAPESNIRNYAHYALEIVRTICTEVGPGLPGTHQEWERAIRIRKELESHLGAENVHIEEFSAAPEAFLGSYPLSALFILIAALLNITVGRFAGVSLWLVTIAALVFSILSPLPYIVEFVFFKEAIDPLFKKRKSVNVIGTLRRPGTRSAKRLLILSGHHDSAFENTWLRFLGYGFFVLSATYYLGLITINIICLLRLGGLFTGNAGMTSLGTLGWVLLVYPIAPSIIYAMFFYRGRKNGGNVPGAADNLSACALVVAACRFLVNNPSYIPPETEIRFISFGSEEAGLRGSRRYVARHLDELKHLDARLLNMETVVHPVITILASDMNGMVKNSPEMVNSVAAAAERASVPYSVNPAYLGVGNDSGPFSQAGIKALTLLPFKVPQQLVALYHQKWDRPENLTLEPLMNVLKLTVEWVRSRGE